MSILKGISSFSSITALFVAIGLALIITVSPVCVATSLAQSDSGVTGGNAGDGADSKDGGKPGTP
ncbi:MAG: hypothetical protein LBF22_02935, partial [Deltaproteobacteria bacterium]|nr:hypothetical protein [Deltaproteobacteria bacterium]